MELFIHLNCLLVISHLKQTGHIAKDTKDDEKNVKLGSTNLQRRGDGPKMPNAIVLT